MKNFGESVVQAVTRHMNGDHAEDNLLIARAFGCPDATSSVMIGLDAHAGVWNVRSSSSGPKELKIAWPDGPITTRPDIRREVVKLYRASCAKLGVPARAEHRADPEPTPRAFSQEIRSATWGDHSHSESASLMADMMRGAATVETYAQLVAQHFFMYDALDLAAQQLSRDPSVAALHPAALSREHALAEDLHQLFGANWRERISMLPATARYVDRISEVSREHWLPGIIAHHYTRYLGDLSGGQMIAKRMRQQHGFTHAGVAFYDFTEIGEIAEFKRNYRAVLDQLGTQLDQPERERMVAEVRAAYRYNTEVFVDLQAHVR